eukprot:COSAG01_NODE_3211_length_6414_cov_7.800475_10_plen_326_part_00
MLLLCLLSLGSVSWEHGALALYGPFLAAAACLVGSLGSWAVRRMLPSVSHRCPYHAPLCLRPVSLHQLLCQAETMLCRPRGGGVTRCAVSVARVGWAVVFDQVHWRQPGLDAVMAALLEEATDRRRIWEARLAAATSSSSSLSSSSAMSMASRRNGARTGGGSGDSGGGGGGGAGVLGEGPPPSSQQGRGKGRRSPSRGGRGGGGRRKRPRPPPPSQPVLTRKGGGGGGGGGGPGAGPCPVVAAAGGGGGGRRWASRSACPWATPQLAVCVSPVPRGTPPSRAIDARQRCRGGGAMSHITSDRSYTSTPPHHHSTCLAPTRPWSC